MKIHVLTLFPDFISGYFNSSIVARAKKNKLIDINIVNIRDFACDTHKSCDDAPYGGGSGMVLKAEPLAAALDSVLAPPSHKKPLTIFPTPAAPLFTQKDAHELALQKELVFICGKYEGVDQRIIDLYADRIYSIGDYVLSSGEIASMVLLDASLRLMDGMIDPESLRDESFVDSLLEYPHYTRPAVFRGLAVPELLLSGNHKEIEKWRTEQKRKRTEAYRPDLLVKNKKKIL